MPALASSPAHTGLFATANTAETAYLNPAGMTRVDDDDRTLSLRLDSIVGVGTGMTFEKGESLVDVNFNLYYLGKAPVDTGFNPVQGRVVGETSNPWAVAFDVAWHW